MDSGFSSTSFSGDTLEGFLSPSFESASLGNCSLAEAQSVPGSWGNTDWLSMPSAAGSGFLSEWDSSNTTALANLQLKPSLLTDWPHVTSAIALDPAVEARVQDLLGHMTLDQKIGQMTQADMAYITPEEAHLVGSILIDPNHPVNGNKLASLQDWLGATNAYHEAPMELSGGAKVPLLFATDAVHGHNNIYGATLFPHNMGLCATGDTALMTEVAQDTAKAVRATGMRWAFAPTIAVAQDDRWGRTYESCSEDPARVAAFSEAYVKGLQGDLTDPGNVLASIKHFIGDGGTDQGVDQGVNKSDWSTLINRDGMPYYAGLRAGAQTVMVSFNSLAAMDEGAAPVKMHGSKTMLTDVLKTKLGFDGVVVTDWNGIGQVPGCTASSCAQAINAGVDMVMAPEHWKDFIANTKAQVESREIPMERINDAVTRILRVKARSGVLDWAPENNPYAGDESALQSRDLARRAVQESLVLLKNDGDVLPLSRGKNYCVVGSKADSFATQTGGWSLTWQNTDNLNSDFIGQTILDGIRQTVGQDHVTYSADAKGLNLSQCDAVVAVVGETPYAEGLGDIHLGGTLRHSERYAEDLDLLNRVSGKGKPVATVMLSGRPVWANDLMNRSNAFVEAWLPGTEGGGVADVLFKGDDGQVNKDFSGRLTFSWPKSPTDFTLNQGSKNYDPLFPVGYGLTYAPHAPLGKLDERLTQAVSSALPDLSIFNFSPAKPFTLNVESPSNRFKQTSVQGSAGTVFELPVPQPDIRVQTVDVNKQEDGKLVEWTGSALSRFFAESTKPLSLKKLASQEAALEFDTKVRQAPQSAVMLEMESAGKFAAGADLQNALTGLNPYVSKTIKVPLSCFSANGVNLGQVTSPFGLSSQGPFAAGITNVRVVPGAADDDDVVPCLTPPGGVPLWR